MSQQKLKRKKQKNLLLDFQQGHSITELAEMYSVSEYTIHKYLTALGVELPNENLPTKEERQLLEKLSQLNISTVTELEAVLKGEPIDHQLMRMNVNEWGSLLYHAAVRRHLVLQAAVDKIKQGDPDANSGE